MKKYVIMLLVLLITLPICLLYINAAEVRLSTVSFQGLSTDTKSTFTNAGYGYTWYETDTGRLFVYDGISWNLKRMVVENSAPDTIITAGAGTAVYSKGMDKAALYVYSGGTAISNIFTMQGKKAGFGGWANLDSDSATTVTDDSTHVVTYTEVGVHDSLRAYAYTISSGDTLFFMLYLCGNVPEKDSY